MEIDEEFESFSEASNASSTADTSNVADQVAANAAANADNNGEPPAPLPTDPPANETAGDPPGSNAEVDDDTYLASLLNADDTTTDAASAQAAAAANHAPVGEAVFIDLARELGFNDIKTRAELLEKVKPVLEAKPAQFEYPDEGVKKAVDNIIEVAKNGGNYQKVADNTVKVSELTGRIKEMDDTVATLQSIVSSPKIEAKRNFLAWYYENELHLKGDALEKVVSNLEMKDDADVFFEAHSRAAELQTKTNATRAQLASEQQVLSNEIATSAERAIKAKAESLRVVNEAISSFKDPHGERFTKTVQEVAKGVFSSDPVPVVIPRGLAERLLTVDGKFNVQKALNSLASIVTAQDKLIHLSKVAKANQFRELRGAQKSTNGSGTGMPAGVNGREEEWTLS